MTNKKILRVFKTIVTITMIIIYTVSLSFIAYCVYNDINIKYFRINYIHVKFCDEKRAQL